MKAHLIMPMGGAGSRFFDDGYIQPKPLIKIYDRPFFYWATQSIVKYIDVKDITFVVLKQHIDEFSIDIEIKKYYPNAYIIALEKILNGPVYTALKGIENIKDDGPLIINDCDHLFRCDEINNILNNNIFKEDGALLTFESNEPQFSYIKYRGTQIVGTIEKKAVSEHAICGAYIFKNNEIFNSMANEYIKNCSYNECFMSGIYNIMCNNNLIIKDYLLNFHVEFGTPKEYRKAQKSKYYKELI
jgi:dTDP-glucose pyrophosphorylase